MSDVQVFTGYLRRGKKGRKAVFLDEPPVESQEKPSRAAVMLAAAYRLQAAMDSGEVRGQAELAERLGVTRARVSQVLALAMKPVEWQEGVVGA